MVRISDDDVTDGGFDTDLDPEEVSDRVADAHHIVSERLEGRGLYSSDRLDLIEKYLTRHLIRFEADRQVQTGQGASTRLQFSGAFDEEGLRATAPGQTALMLDEENALGDSRDQAQFEVF